MHAKLDNWQNGWYGVSVGLSAEEVDRLIALLTNIRDTPDQHFHMSSNYVGDGGLGDIEFYMTDSGSPSNMHFSSVALAPGSEPRTDV